VEAVDLKALLTGALPPLESRMRFHYDFILKHRLTSGSTIVEQSYWAVQQAGTRRSLAAEIQTATATAAAAAAAVTDADRALIAAYTDVSAGVHGKKNAALRRAQGALAEWLSENGGAVFERAKAKVARAAEATVARDRLTAQAAAWDEAPLLSLGPQEACLEKWGFLTGTLPSQLPSPYPLLSDLGLTSTETPYPLLSDLGCASTETPYPLLSDLGCASTETNEGHGILMPLLAVSGRCAPLTAEEIACVLAGFLREGGGSDKQPSIEAAGLRTEVTDVLYWIDETARACERDEDAAHVLSPSGFWDLSPLWVCVAARWIAGAGLSAIAAEFDLFEGNVQRGLLRIANLLEEWGSVATLRRDLATLEALGSLRFLRDEVVVDSLYLRL
jgi:hypothetical protein